MLVVDLRNRAHDHPDVFALADMHRSRDDRVRGDLVIPRADGKPPAFRSDALRRDEARPRYHRIRLSHPFWWGDQFPLRIVAAGDRTDRQHDLVRIARDHFFTGADLIPFEVLTRTIEHY